MASTSVLRVLFSFLFCLSLISSTFAGKLRAEPAAGRFTDAVTVWGTTKMNQACYRMGVTKQNPGGDEWIIIQSPEIAAGIRQISVGLRKVVWAIGRDDKLYFRSNVNEANYKGDGWTAIEALPSGRPAQYVSCSETICWVIDTESRLFVRTGITGGNPAGASWYQVDADHPMEVSTAIGGQLSWMVSADKKVYYLVGNDFTHPDELYWTIEPNQQGFSVASTADSAWLINQDNQCYRRRGVAVTNRAGTAWDSVGGYGSWIAAGFNGLVWMGSNKDGAVDEIMFRTGFSASSPNGVEWRKVDQKQQGLGVVRVTISLDGDDPQKPMPCADIVAEVEILEKQRQALQAEFDLLNANITSVQGENSGLEQKLSELTDKLAKLKQERDVMATRADRAKKAAQTLEAERNRLQTDLKKAETQLAQMQALAAEEPARIAREVSQQKQELDLEFQESRNRLRDEYREKEDILRNSFSDKNRQLDEQKALEESRYQAERTHARSTATQRMQDALTELNRESEQSRRKREAEKQLFEDKKTQEDEDYINRLQKLEDEEQQFNIKKQSAEVQITQEQESFADEEATAQLKMEGGCPVCSCPVCPDEPLVKVRTNCPICDCEASNKPSDNAPDKVFMVDPDHPITSQTYNKEHSQAVQSILPDSI